VKERGTNHLFGEGIAMGVCLCPQHGRQGQFHGCRHACIAVGTGGHDPGLTWWECRLRDDPTPVFAVWLCRGCIEQYRLPPSVAVLDDPAFPPDEQVPVGELALPICGACFEEWRTAHGEAVAGPRYTPFAQAVEPDHPPRSGGRC